MVRRPGRVLTASGSLTGLLVIGWTSVAAAQQAPRFSLSWDGPPGCPTAENVQARVDALYRQPEAWARQCALNIAAMGGFSSDRTIREYADRIWRAPAAD